VTLFTVTVWWADLFNNVEIYLGAKFRQGISIHGWDKTTSGFRKRTAAILEFYFRFRFSSAWHFTSACQIS